MACFDDQGRLYVCNNAGVNMSNEELEKQLPNSIRRLVDSDATDRFDQSTVFADKMTFPMGGAWHDGSLVRRLAAEHLETDATPTTMASRTNAK